MYNILVTKHWKNTFELIIIILSNPIRHDRGVHAETWVKIMFQNILYTTEVWFGGFCDQNKYYVFSTKYENRHHECTNMEQQISDDGEASFEIRTIKHNIVDKSTVYYTSS